MMNFCPETSESEAPLPPPAAVAPPPLPKSKLPSDTNRVSDNLRALGNLQHSHRSEGSMRSMSVNLGGNNNEEEKEKEEAKPVEAEQRKTLFKQKTMVNPDIDRAILKGILSSPANPLKSFNAKPSKEHWKLCIFELGKRQYHVFENKMVANYNIPIVPEDETLIL